MNNDPARRERMYAIRRADGELMGDFSFYVANGPDDWSTAESEMESGDPLDDPVEFELVTFEVVETKRRVFAPAESEIAAAAAAFLHRGTDDESVPNDGTED